MSDTPHKPPAKRRALLAAVGLSLGGLAPLVTGLVGFWSYSHRGYLVTKTGDVVDGPSGLVVSGLFVLVGLAMIGKAVLDYRRSLGRHP